MRNRIKEVRKQKGISLARLEELTGISAQQINRLERGTRRINEDNLIKIAAALSCQPQELFSAPAALRVMCYVGAGGEVLAYDETEKTPEDKEVECPPGLNPSTVVAIRIKGGSMLPVLQPEWIVYYSDRRDIEIPVLRDGWQVPYNKPAEEPLSEFYGKLCIVKLVDGRTMLRTLKKGHAPNRYNLTIPSAADIEDAELQWAAKIIFIKTA